MRRRRAAERTRPATSFGAPFTARRVEHIRRAFGLRSRYERLRAQGFLTLPEMAQRLGICRAPCMGGHAEAS